MSGQRLTPYRLSGIRASLDFVERVRAGDTNSQSVNISRYVTVENYCNVADIASVLLAELDAVTRERDEAQLTLAEWRTDLGPLVAQHRNGDLTAADGPYLPAERDDETIPLGFHEGDAGGQP